MREIEFRGKTKDGRWVFGLYVNYSKFEDGVADSIEIHRHSIKRFDGGDIEDIDPSTRGQYTGLKDRHGVKIFEGDIVKSPSRSVYQIEWVNNDYYYGFYVCDSDGNMPIKHFLKSFPFEVIGNIHDNMELLEAGE